MPKCHSTNDLANNLSEKGLIQNGDVVITNIQNQGRGQRGNRWQSEPGKNLTFSVFLSPVVISIEKNFFLNIFSSMAIQAALSQFLPGHIKVKWPNDIYANDRKIGGILIENSIQSGSIASSIVGVGLNINQVVFPKEIIATSLANELGRNFELNDIFNQVIVQIDAFYNLMVQGKFRQLRETYLNALFWKDEVHLFEAKTKFEGIIRGIDDMGRIIIETKDKELMFNFKEVNYIL